MNQNDADELMNQVVRWAAAREDIRGVALAGSYARGTAGPDSDLDLLLICLEPERYLQSREWIAEFGAVERAGAVEDWGKVQSVRVFYAQGREVEFGIAGMDWVALPADEGTAEVVRAGARVLLDRDGTIAALIRSATG